MKNNKMFFGSIMPNLKFQAYEYGDDLNKYCDGCNSDFRKIQDLVNHKDYSPEWANLIIKIFDIEENMRKKLHKTKTKLRFLSLFKDIRLWIEQQIDGFRKEIRKYPILGKNKYIETLQTLLENKSFCQMYPSVLDMFECEVLNPLKTTVIKYFEISTDETNNLTNRLAAFIKLRDLNYSMRVFVSNEPQIESILKCFNKHYKNNKIKLENKMDKNIIDDFKKSGLENFGEFLSENNFNLEFNEEDDVFENLSIDGVKYKVDKLVRNLTKDDFGEELTNNIINISDLLKRIINVSNDKEINEYVEKKISKIVEVIEKKVDTTTSRGDIVRSSLKVIYNKLKEINLNSKKTNLESLNFFDLSKNKVDELLKEFKDKIFKSKDARTIDEIQKFYNKERIKLDESSQINILIAPKISFSKLFGPFDKFIRSESYHENAKILSNEINKCTKPIIDWMRIYLEFDSQNKIKELTNLETLSNWIENIQKEIDETKTSHILIQAWKKFSVKISEIINFHPSISNISSKDYKYVCKFIEYLNYLNNRLDYVRKSSSEVKFKILENLFSLSPSFSISQNNKGLPIFFYHKICELFLNLCKKIKEFIPECMNLFEDEEFESEEKTIFKLKLIIFLNGIKDMVLPEDVINKNDEGINKSKKEICDSLESIKKSINLPNEKIKNLNNFKKLCDDLQNKKKSIMNSLRLCSDELANYKEKSNSDENFYVNKKLWENLNFSELNDKNIDFDFYNVYKEICKKRQNTEDFQSTANIIFDTISEKINEYLQIIETNNDILNKELIKTWCNFCHEVMKLRRSMFSKDNLNETLRVRDVDFDYVPGDLDSYNDLRDDIKDFDMDSIIYSSLWGKLVKFANKLIGYNFVETLDKFNKCIEICDSKDNHEACQLSKCLVTDLVKVLNVITEDSETKKESDFLCDNYSPDNIKKNIKILFLYCRFIAEKKENQKNIVKHNCEKELEYCIKLLQYIYHSLFKISEKNNDYSYKEYSWYNLSKNVKMWITCNNKPILRTKDVAQGYVGDCYLMASLLSLLPSNQDLILNCFPYEYKEISNEGNILTDNVTVRLYKVKSNSENAAAQNGYVDVILDATALQDIARDFKCNQNKIVVWPLFIEKAMSTINKNKKYVDTLGNIDQSKIVGRRKEDLESGSSMACKCMLTGKPYTRLYFKFMEECEVFSNLCDAKQKRSANCATKSDFGNDSKGKPTEEVVMSNGETIYSNHSYKLVDIKFDIEKKPIIIVHNPWNIEESNLIEVPLDDFIKYFDKIDYAS